MHLDTNSLQCTNRENTRLGNGIYTLIRHPVYKTMNVDCRNRTEQTMIFISNLSIYIYIYIYIYSLSLQTKHIYIACTNDII